MESIQRCPWANRNLLLKEYHDQRWAKPMHDDRQLFELLVQCIFEGGLSWFLILKKEAAFKKAFANYDLAELLKFNEQDLKRLFTDKSIIRNKRKIEAVVFNTPKFIAIQQEFSTFDNYCWQFVNYQPIIKTPKNDDEVAIRDQISDKFSADLKKRGFVYVGSLTMYAFMQSSGMVDDHLVNCAFKTKSLST